MDPLKTAFIDSIPTENESAIASALKPLGLVKWTPVQSGCGFAQFSSAAQVKAALEVLPMADLSIAVSEDTKTWVSRAAAKATVQNVTRMSPIYLSTKIKTALNKARTKEQEKPSESTPPPIAPDGTLEINDPKLWDEIRRFREQSLASKKKDAQEKVPGPPDTKRARGTNLDAPSNADLKNEQKQALGSVPSRQSPLSRSTSPGASSQEKPHDSSSRPAAPIAKSQSNGRVLSTSAEKITALSPNARVDETTQTLTQMQPPSVPPNGAESEDTNKLAAGGTSTDPEKRTGTDINAAAAPEQPSKQQNASGNDLSVDKLSSLVEEFFGIPDEDVVSTLETHIREKRSEALLAAEFQEVLENDFPRFSEEVKRLME